MAIGFKHGSCGADLLNLKVENSKTEPVSPKENTIWVEGKYSMHRWDISPDQPCKVGKKNLIVYPYYETSHTEDGITFTDNGDGTVTANGTATAESNFRFSYTSAESGMFMLTPGTYTMSGCPSGGSGSTYRLYLTRLNDSGVWEIFKNDGGNGNTFTVSKDTYCCVLFRVFKGATVAGLTVSPMLVKGSASAAFDRGNATGQVWIKTAEAGSVSLNTIKKNGIFVHPVSAYEYSTVYGWEKRDLQIYQRGAWTNPLFYIYNKGGSTGYSFACDENMRQLSGGHTAEAERVTEGSSSITVKTSNRSYDFTNIFVTDTSGSFAKVDLSNWSKVRIKGTLTGATKNTECVFRVMSAMGTLCTENNVVSKSFTAGTIDATIDVSAVDSSCYLGFTVYNDSANNNVITFVLTESWLE